MPRAYTGEGDDLYHVIAKDITVLVYFASRCLRGFPWTAWGKHQQQRPTQDRPRDMCCPFVGGTSVHVPFGSVRLFSDETFCDAGMYLKHPDQLEKKLVNVVVLFCFFDPREQDWKKAFKAAVVVARDNHVDSFDSMMFINVVNLYPSTIDVTDEAVQPVWDDVHSKLLRGGAKVSAPCAATQNSPHNAVAVSGPTTARRTSARVVKGASSDNVPSQTTRQSPRQKRASTGVWRKIPVESTPVQRKRVQRKRASGDDTAVCSPMCSVSLRALCSCPTSWCSHRALPTLQANYEVSRAHRRPSFVTDGHAASLEFLH